MPPPIAAPAPGEPTAAPIIAPVAAPIPVPMNVPFSRVESGSPEQPTTATIATATSRPLTIEATIVRTSLPPSSSFHARTATAGNSAPIRGNFVSYQPSFVPQLGSNQPSRIFARLKFLQVSCFSAAH
jgi:hypothetical protein